METEIVSILKSMSSMDESFRDQVQKYRDFREEIEQSGIKVEGENYHISLMGRMQPPPNKPNLNATFHFALDEIVE